jgi:hypothetical protein
VRPVIIRSRLGTTQTRARRGAGPDLLDRRRRDA